MYEIYALCVFVQNNSERKDVGCYDGLWVHWIVLIWT